MNDLELIKNQKHKPTKPFITKNDQLDFHFQLVSNVYAWIGHNSVIYQKKAPTPQSQIDKHCLYANVMFFVAKLDDK